MTLLPLAPVVRSCCIVIFPFADISISPEPLCPATIPMEVCASINISESALICTSSPEFIIIEFDPTAALEIFIKPVAVAAIPPLPDVKNIVPVPAFAPPACIVFNLKLLPEYKFISFDVELIILIAPACNCQLPVCIAWFVTNEI